MNHLANSPSTIMKNATTIVAGSIKDKSTAAPIDPNKNGQQTAHTTLS